MGGVSFTPAERSMREGLPTPNSEIVDPVFLGLKVMMMEVCPGFEDEHSFRTFSYTNVLYSFQSPGLFRNLNNLIPPLW